MYEYITLVLLTHSESSSKLFHISLLSPKVFKISSKSLFNTKFFL